MQPFIKFIADNSFIGKGSKDTMYAQVVGPWKTDCESAFRALSLSGKCKHLIRQALVVNFIYRVYHKEPFFLFTEYKDQLVRWLDELNGNTGENDPMVVTAIQVARMLLNEDEEATFLYPSLDGMEVFLDPSSDTEPIPRIGEKGFYLPYMYFVTKTAVYKSLGKGHKIDKADDFKYPLAAIPAFNFFDDYVVIEYVNLPEFHFDVNLLNSTADQGPDYFKSIFGYLLCHDWSDKNMSDVMSYLSNFALIQDLNAIPQNNIAQIYNKLWRAVTQHVGNIPANIVCDVTEMRRFINFILMLRKEKGVELNEPQMLADFISNGEPTRLQGDEKNLAEYLKKVQTNNETSMEEYHAFKASIFGDFKELDSSLVG